MKRITPLLLVLCLLLTGCGNWMDGNYISVMPHLEENSGASQEMISVSSYIELRDALCELVEDGVESAAISVEAIAQDQIERNMDMAVRYVTSSHPIGAYALENVTYEQGTIGGVSAVALTITYNLSRAEIRRIQRVEGMESATKTITNALDNCDAGIVLLVNGYSKTDFPELIQTYANEHPESVMEIPAVTVNIYPDSGVNRVVELKFSYQNSREALRSMQERVTPVFTSARLYVSSVETDEEKYAQLFSFLVNRFDYQFETSITPSYSLLCHGVGDSKAHALAYAAMCRQVGLECLVVTGTRDAEPWFWNIICDNGVYYHVDLIRFSSIFGDFQALSDEDMTGYVWDYSAYPECVMPEEQPEASKPNQAGDEQDATEPETVRPTSPPVPAEQE